MAPRRGAPARKGTGTQEMRFLADLIGGDEITDDAASAAAKMNLNLFGDDDSDAAGAGGDAQSQVCLFFDGAYVWIRWFQNTNHSSQTGY